MYISEINSAKAICVQADMSAAKAFQLIRDVDHTKFPVVDKEGKLVGIVEKSELEDISSSSSPFKELRFSSILSGTKVRDLMNNNVYYAKETDTIWTAALNMKDHRVSILPVVDE
ncbi:MAG: CBS domain-containing protein [Clostridiales bacterium]|nr:CBS domain-containing protein [Clostridiales bacterium]